jgi:hypothetical protein
VRSISRITRGPRAVAASATALALVASMLAVSPSALAVRADTSPPAASERAQAVVFLRTGGPLVTKAASAALVGADADVHRFLTELRPVAAEQDDRVQLTKLMAASGPGVRAAGNVAMSGTIADVRRGRSGGGRGSRARGGSCRSWWR